MGYLKEFQTQITNRDFAKFLKLWEEYCTCDEADTDEIKTLLSTLKSSDFAKSFGPYVGLLIPLWQTIQKDEESYQILSLILDLQTTNSPQLADHALEALRKQHSSKISFQDREIQEALRLVGLRSKDQFQSALSNFDLLIHLKKGNFVFHASGFGVGEIMDASSLRELVSVEFENTSGIKQITFTNAFKSLIPLSSAHFLAKRFSNPDAFEKEAKENPLGVLKLLLKDLGPKTAAELKDELSELVIPEADWQKWWQNARAKLKKDTEIESPSNAKDPFILRKEAVSHEEQFLESIKKKSSFSEFLTASYNFIRDYSSKLKNNDLKNEIVSRIESFLKSNSLNPAERLQAYFCLDSLHGVKHEAEISKILKESDALDSLLEHIDIIVYKKLAITAIKAHLENWPSIYLRLLQTCNQGMLRDYLIKELVQGNNAHILQKGFQDLLESPWENAELFVWYYHKLMNEADEGLPFQNREGKDAYSQGLLVLLNRIENDPGQKELVKKIYMMTTAKRYSLIRQIFQDSSLEFAKEFLLLATKCHTITDHDLMIWRSLVEVVHPSLGSSGGKKVGVDTTIWTTEATLLREQERLKKIATTNVIENAKEIEAARALGDLRENSEYKSALEKRALIQREIKKLSAEISNARVLTPADIQSEEAGIGSVIHASDTTGTQVKFTIMGPWEADPDNHILSSHSKVGMSLIGLHVEDTFKFKEVEYKIQKLGSIFDEE